MMNKIIALTTLLISISGFSQKNNISPYSFFGIGEINEAKSVAEQTMGIGTAVNSSYRLSFSNPASLGSLKFTTYTLAGANNFLRVDDGSETQASSAFSLSYLAFGVPIGKNGGASFGLQPYSKVGYNIINKYKNDADETESDLFVGEGGTNRFFMAYGYKFPHQISVGVEVSYIFGNLKRTILHRNQSVGERLATRYHSDTEITGFSYKFGAQNTLKVNDKLDLKTGMSFLLQSKLDNKGNEKLITLLNSTNPDIVIPRDEILNQDSNGEITLPLKTSLSFGIGKGSKWFVGYEYSFQKAIDFNDNSRQNNNTIYYDKSYNIAIGGFYTPKAESITSYWHRITYRAGGHLKNTGLVINNTPIKDFGMSFGVSLPSKRQLSNINLGFDIGKRGEIDNNGLIKENYFNFRLSLSLNDKWFNKRKLD